MSYPNKQFAFILFFLGFIRLTSGQVCLFNPESMYNGTGGVNGESISSWEISNRFENDLFTMSGSGDMRSSFPSDYLESSGSWNVMLNLPGEYFQLDGINTSSLINLTLSVGIRKSTNSEDGSGIEVQFSSDQLTWIPLPLMLPTGVGTAGWHFVTLPGTIPSVSELSLRFRSTSGTEFRLDDIQLHGDPPCMTHIDSIHPLSGPEGTEIILSGSGFLGITGILINSQPIPDYEIVSDIQVVAIIPAGAETGFISVQTSCQSQYLTPFELIRSSCDQNGCDLIISELCDPSEDYQTDRYIEIFNPTAHVILLESWKVKAIANYTECETWDLFGAIQPGEAKTCGYTNPLHGGPHDFQLSGWLATIPGGCCSNWNGNQRDGAALYYGNSRVDLALFGNSAFPWFSDRTLIRSDSVCCPNPEEHASGWMVSPVLTFAGDIPSSPHSHIVHCGGDPPHILVDSATFSICAGYVINLSVSATAGQSPFEFRWKNLDPTGSWVPIPLSYPYSVNSTATGSVLTIETNPAIVGQLQLYCEVVNANGGCWSASRAMILQIQAPPETQAIVHR